MSKSKESSQFSLMGDLDGMTVRSVIEMFEEFASEHGDDAYVDARTQSRYGYGGYIQGYGGDIQNEEEFFVIKEKK